jgi:transposase
VDEFTRRLVPDGLWEITEPLIPAPPKRAQGGGIPRTDDRQVFCASCLSCTTGCAWRHLPPTFGVSHQTAHRRFNEWSEAALWAKLHRTVLNRLGAAGEIDWSRAIVDGASLRAKKQETHQPRHALIEPELDGFSVVAIQFVVSPRSEFRCAARCAAAAMKPRSWRSRR